MLASAWARRHSRARPARWDSLARRPKAPPRAPAQASLFGHQACAPCRPLPGTHHRHRRSSRFRPRPRGTPAPSCRCRRQDCSPQRRSVVRAEPPRTSPPCAPADECPPRPSAPSRRPSRLARCASPWARATRRGQPPRSPSGCSRGCGPPAERASFEVSTRQPAAARPDGEIRLLPTGDPRRD